MSGTDNLHVSVSSAIRLSLISFWTEAIIRMRIVNWIISHIVEVVVWLIVTFIGTSIIKKLPMKLGENALIGWIDDRLGEFLGISAPTLQQVVTFSWDYLFPAIFALLVLWAYHVFNNRALAPQHWRRQLLGLALIAFGVLATFAGASLLITRNKDQPTVPTAANPIPPQMPPVAHLTEPSQPQRPYTERQIRELLDALADAQTLVSKQLLPLSIKIEVEAANWRGLAGPTQGAASLARSLTESRERLQAELWKPLSDFVYRDHADYSTEMRMAFLLDNEAARGELTRSLQTAADAIRKLPDTPSEQLMDLVTPQFDELRKQSNAVYGWLFQVTERMKSMSNNLRTKGITGFESAK
jgi:hypothetical protein